MKKKIWEGVPEGEWTIEMHLAKLDYDWERLEEKETRRHESIDSHEPLGDIETECTHSISLDAFEFKHGIYSPSAEDVYIEGDDHVAMIRAVRAAIAKLKPSHKEIVIAVYFSGLSLSQYAELRGVTRKATSKQMLAAKRNLKKFLENG